MSSTRSIWKKAFAASQQLKGQKIVSNNTLLDSIPQIASVSANNLSRRNAHFTFNPDPTDTSKGKIEMESLLISISLKWCILHYSLSIYDGV